MATDGTATAEATVRRLWALFSAQAWAEAKTLFAADFVAEWPQTREPVHKLGSGPGPEAPC